VSVTLIILSLIITLADHNITKWRKERVCSIEIERRMCRIGGSNNSLIMTHAEYNTRFNYRERVCSIATMISEHTQNYKVN